MSHAIPGLRERNTVQYSLETFLRCNRACWAQRSGRPSSCDKRVRVKCCMVGHGRENQNAEGGGWGGARYRIFEMLVQMTRMLGQPGECC